jgi:hypothetical protein
MAIYTPRGLKIRFSVPYAFSLMARLFPDITPFRVLKKTEAIENVSDVMAVIEAVIIIFFFPGAPLVNICAAVMGIYFIGYIMKIAGIFIPLIVPISEIFSYIYGYGIITIVLGIFGFLNIGLLKTAVLLAVLLATNIFDYLIEMIRAILCKAMDRPYLGVSEIDFINAYKILAASIGTNINTNVTEQEINSEAWREPYLWLEINWPEIESKYTVQG